VRRVPLSGNGRYSTKASFAAGVGEFSTRLPHAPLAIRPKRPTNVHDGKGFIVTGGAGGIGGATAELLIAEGARVVLADVRRDALDKTAETIANVNAFVVTFDAANPASIGAAIAAAEGRLGRLDGLVNCAAIVVHSDPLEARWSDWERIFSINVFGAYEARAWSPNR